MQYTLHLTNQCNFTCDYCNVSKGDAAMSKETARNVVNYAVAQAKKTGKSSICLSFYGGEPLLQKELIFDVVDYCAHISAGTDLRFTYRMTTNGVLLDEDFLSFAAANRFKIALSIDGTKTVHNRHRSYCDGSTTFADVSAAAKRLLAHFPDSYAMMTVNPDTATHLLASVQFLYNIGFRAFATTPNFSVTWAGNELEQLAEQYKQLADWYAAKLLAEEALRLPLFDNKLMGYLTPTVLEGKCTPAKHGVSVSMTGEIYPCTQYAYHPQYAIGSVGGIINNQALNDIRQTAAIRPTECQSCALQDRCDNQCGCRNLAATGHINQVSPLFCAHERILIPLADALGERIFIST